MKFSSCRLVRFTHAASSFRSHCSSTVSLLTNCSFSTSSFVFAVPVCATSLDDFETKPQRIDRRWKNERTKRNERLYLNARFRQIDTKRNFFAQINVRIMSLENRKRWRKLAEKKFVYAKENRLIEFSTYLFSKYIRIIQLSLLVENIFPILAVVNWWMLFGCDVAFVCYHWGRRSEEQLSSSSRHWSPWNRPGETTTDCSRSTNRRTFCRRIEELNKPLRKTKRKTIDFTLHRGRIKSRWMPKCGGSRPVHRGVGGRTGRSVATGWGMRVEITVRMIRDAGRIEIRWRIER